MPISLQNKQIFIRKSDFDVSLIFQFNKEYYLTVLLFFMDQNFPVTIMLNNNQQQLSDAYLEPEP